MQAVTGIEVLKQKLGVPYVRILREVGIGYGCFLRWKRRIASGLPPLKSPGPKKVLPFDLDELTRKIESLQHGKKRTRDTGNLHETYKHVISRRELNALVIQVRQEMERKRASTINQVFWRRPDVAWAFDGTEYKPGYRDGKMHVQNLQDLCSRYKFSPMTTDYTPCGEEVAGHLDHLFTRYGPPLFCKRDNAGNLNHVAVNQVLEDAMVIPINSPVNNAPYNGAVEHAQGEVKQYLRAWDGKAKTNEEFALLAETAAHDWNHRTRRSLGGGTACRSYFGNNRIRYTKRQRKAVYEWIRNLAVDISHGLGQSEISCLSWRVAAKKWLEKNGLITIRKNGKVLPPFQRNLCHN